MRLKHFTKLLFMVALLVGTWQGQIVAQTYFGDSAGDPLPDTGTSGGFESVATVPVSGTIGVDATIDEVTLDLLHTFDGDLDIELVSPAGTSIFLSDSNGGAGDDYMGTSFVDGFPSIGAVGSPPFSDVFGPDGGSMNAIFAGECISGDWTLSIFDNFAGDSGTFLGFSITFTTAGGACTSPPPCTINSYAGDSEGDPLPDVGTSGSFESDIVVPDAGTIGVDATIESVELNLSHTFDGDLEIELIAPSGGSSLVLSDNNGGAGDDYIGTVFMDGAPTIGGSAPFSGIFEPDGGTFAAAFAGESITGTWTLGILDGFAGDSGTFGNVTLNICVGDGGPVCEVSGYTLTEIGCAGGPSDYCYDAPTDCWTVSSETCYNPAFYRSTDDEAFVHTEVCGDVEIIAEVTGITGNGFGGIMLREDLSDDSRNISLMIDGASLTRRELRQSTGGTAFAHLFQTVGRNWLRLTRSGNIFSAFHSDDGVSWQTVITTQIAMANCIEVGLMTQNSASSGEVEAIFKNVSISTPGPLSAPTVEYDIAQELPTNVEVYPNPASTEVNVILGDFYGEAVEIQVYNKLGQIVSRKVIDEVTFGVETMDVSQFSNGTYLFKIVTDTQKETRRVVVNR